MAIKGTIGLEIEMDNDNLPEKIYWDASNSPFEDKQSAKAFLLSIWDGEAKNTMKMDLWTKDMTIEEMNHFFFQSLFTLAETFQKATNDTETATKLKEFAKAFAQKQQLIKE
ncbi:MAG: gliding motility protein GldC [Chitinophagales bacterium]|nr:gliding motility protein GldC [Bacteroidota bacterium]MCB9042639.1 gliding motility protein GldC [Chitinophagales bacterium]